MDFEERLAAFTSGKVLQYIFDKRFWETFMCQAACQGRLTNYSQKRGKVNAQPHACHGRKVCVLDKNK